MWRLGKTRECPHGFFLDGGGFIEEQQPDCAPADARGVHSLKKAAAWIWQGLAEEGSGRN